MCHVSKRYWVNFVTSLISELHFSLQQYRNNPIFFIQITEIVVHFTFKSFVNSPTCIIISAHSCAKISKPEKIPRGKINKIIWQWDICLTKKTHTHLKFRNPRSDFPKRDSREFEQFFSKNSGEKRKRINHIIKPSSQPSRCHPHTIFFYASSSSIITRRLMTYGSRVKGH